MKSKLKIVITNQFKRDLKLLKNRGKDLNKLQTVVDMLASRKLLPAQYKDHGLRGTLKGIRDCHIEPDWILLYEIIENQLILQLSRTGSHSDIF